MVVNVVIHATRYKVYNVSRMRLGTKFIMGTYMRSGTKFIIYIRLGTWLLMWSYMRLGTNFIMGTYMALEMVDFIIVNLYTVDIVDNLCAYYLVCWKVLFHFIKYYNLYFLF